MTAPAVRSSSELSQKLFATPEELAEWQLRREYALRANDPVCPLPSRHSDIYWEGLERLAVELHRVIRPESCSKVFDRPIPMLFGITYREALRLGLDPALLADVISRSAGCPPSSHAGQIYITDYYTRRAELEQAMTRHRETMPA